MKKQFDILKQTRTNILRLAGNFSLEDLNTIPEGFKNNLMWQLGHVMVTQQLLCYRLSGVNCLVSEAFIEKYRKGTRPERPVLQSELELILSNLKSLPENLEEDYEREVFQNYKTYTTSYGIKLHTVEEAIAFNNVHEAMHFGTMLAMQKLL